MASVDRRQDTHQVWMIGDGLPNGLRFSCGPKPAAAQMNLFLSLHARQLQTRVMWRPPAALLRRPLG
jgi:hypothetical protein